MATTRGFHINIILTEPVLFLEAYNKDDHSTKKCNVIRGQLHLKVTKATKIKKIWIRFYGQIQMKWPEADCVGERTLLTQGVTYFDRKDTVIQRNKFGADFFQFSDVAFPTSRKAMVIATTDALHQQNQSFASNEAHGCLLASDNSGATLPRPNTTNCQYNYELFPAGDYLYNFEFVVDGSLPETIKTDLSSVQYHLQAFVDPFGHFRSTLTGKLEVPIVRLPADNSLELIEPVTMSCVWRDKLHSKVIMTGKSFPLGSQIPISLKLIPMANPFCHWIKVYVTEHVQHVTRGKGARRLLLPTKKVLLFEKQGGCESASTYPGSEIRIISGGGMERAGNTPTEDSTQTPNLLGAGPSDTEFDLKVQLPTCHEMKRRENWQCLNIDTETESLKVNHWIQIVLRCSNLDTEDPSWNKPVEVTLQSPFDILSCKATPANIFVPAYAMRPEGPIDAVQRSRCACSGPAASRPTSSEQDANTQQQINSNDVNLITFKWVNNVM